MGLNLYEATISREVCYYALALSILTDFTHEQSFYYLLGQTTGKKKIKHPRAITDQDIQDMIELKKTMTYREIGKIYNLSPEAVYRRIQRYRRRKESMDLVG